MLSEFSVSWSVITDHCNKYNEKFWYISRITKMRHKDVKWANTDGKMTSTALLVGKFSTNLQFLKNKISAKCSKAKAQ